MVFQKMKEIQREETSKIVLAIGSYDFGGTYKKNMRDVFRDAVK